MTLTDAQIRGLLTMEAKASREPRHEEVLFYSMGLPFTREEVALIVATRAHLRDLCEEVLRLRAENDRLRLLHKIAHGNGDPA